MPCRNDYIQMVKLQIKRNIKENFSYRANDFEIGITEKIESQERKPYLAVFDINELIKGVTQGSIYNCLCIEKKHKMLEFLKR